MHQRLCSLAFHDESWPGQLVLFSSEDGAERERAWKRMRSDYEIFLKVVELGKTMPFYRKAAAMSPFKTVIVAEVAEAVLGATDETRAPLAECLREYTKLLFEGFGQTKVVEDSFQVLRDRESRDVCNKILHILRQLACLVDGGTLEKHKRKQVEVVVKDSKPSEVTAADLNASKASPKVDLDSLRKRATWPTFSAQSFQNVASLLSLQRHCSAAGQLDQMHLSWKVSLLPRQSVVLTRTGEHLLVLGTTANVLCAAAWSLTERATKAGPHFSLAAGVGGPSPARWIGLLAWDEVQVVPVEVVSPMHQYASGGAWHAGGGISWRQTRPSESVLEFAARHCFWELDSPKLVKVAGSLGLIDPPTDLGELIPKLLRQILGPVPKAELDAIMALRGVCPVDPIPAIVPRDLLEDGLQKDDIKDYEDPALLLR